MRAPGRPPYALLGVGALLGAGLAVGQATEPRAPGPPAGGPAGAAALAPVVGRLVVCPELVKTGEDVKTRLTAGTATLGVLSVRAATLTPTGGLGRVVLAEGGRVGVLNLRSDNAVAVAVTAAGDQAGALEVEQLSRGADGIQRGYANVRCESTSQDTWFVGGSTAETADTQLVLVNPYDQQALVDLELYARSGRVETPSAEGIVVPGRRRLVVKLGDLMPEESALAVRVVAVEGRIAPALRDARAHGDLPLGVDWVPRAGAPAHQVDLPGVPGGRGPRRVYLFAPGEDDAVVRVQTTYADGQFVPDGLEEVTVPAGRVKVLDLTKTVSEVDRRTGERVAKPVSIRVLADGAPVLAGVLAENVARYSRIHEIAYVGAALPLTGPSLVTDAETSDAIESTVYLVAPDGPARVTVRPVPITGQPVPARTYTFAVPQGRLVAFPVRERFPGARLQALTVTPESGTVYAARHLFELGQRGPLMSVLPLATQPAAGVPLPRVVVDPRVALVDPRVAE